MSFIFETINEERLAQPLILGGRNIYPPSEKVKTVISPCALIRKKSIWGSAHCFKKYL